MFSLLQNKFIVCGLLAVLILIPLEMIGGLVRERQTRQAEVEAEIARSGTGAQIVAGPVLILPCKESWDEVTAQWQGAPPLRAQKSRDCTQVVLPERLTIDGEVDTDERRRGIYDVLVYSTSLRLSGHYTLPAAPLAEHPEGTIELGAATLSLGLTDPRGIAVAPVLTLAGAEHGFEPGARLPALGAGIHAALGQLARDGAPLDFQLAMRLNGMQQLDFLPLGRQTHAQLTSAWQHPSFVGAYLPTTRQVDADGFSAQWDCSFLATNIVEQFERSLGNVEERAAMLQNGFGVRFVPAVDVYLKSERATKYGILFVGICFVSLLLTEVLKQLRIHPVQYGMAAVALSIFFLLVLALSEHFGFLPAYAIASVACVGLLGFYLAHIVRDRRLAAGFSGVLAALYGLLYGLLSAEDYALLMGSLLVFGLVAAVMVLTRRIDWYAFGAGDRLPDARRG